MAQVGTPLSVTVSKTWDGQEAPVSDRVNLAISPAAADSFKIVVDAPFHNDTKPQAEAGSMMQLWDYEVVELFVLGEDQHYLELEFGPHGHYLALKLHGPRNIVEQELPLQYTVTITDDRSRWHGTATIPNALLPPRPSKFNAYAIHGEGDKRTYMSLFPSTGGEDAPDFHRLQYCQDLPSPSPFSQAPQSDS